jgi:hypothetical protein
MTHSPEEPMAGRGALRDRLPPLDPPPELADRVRRTLGTRGLVRRPARRVPTWMTRSGLIAAGIMLGILGRGAYQEAVESGGAASVTPPGHYVLLLYGDTPGDTGAVHLAREREYGRRT